MIGITAYTANRVGEIDAHPSTGYTATATSFVFDTQRPRLKAELLAVAGVESLPAHVLKPMAMLALGTINEITYALIRKEPGVDPEQCLDLLVRALHMWNNVDVKTWEESQ